jgi:hypothetical protein
MSPPKKTLIVVFCGIAVMVVTTVCGAKVGFSLDDGGPRNQMHAFTVLFEGLFGGVIGAVVGVPIWVWLGYMVCRNKNAEPNGVKPDDSTKPDNLRDIGHKLNAADK